MDSIPDAETSKDIRRAIKIRLQTLSKDSRARQIADAANDDRANQLYADGHSLAEVGKQLGVEAGTVGRRSNVLA
jgi:prepilin-type processing-associated H-X9-DG protein